MKSNTIKTLAVIVALTAASIPYHANALNTPNTGIEAVVNQKQESKRVTGTVTHVDEESITAYTGSPSQIRGLATFYYEIISVATSEGDTLKFLVPQPTEYKIGDSFGESVKLQENTIVGFASIVENYSKYNGSFQSGYLKVDGIIKR